MKGWDLFGTFMNKKDPEVQQVEAELRFAEQEPGAIHREPNCLGYNRCRQMDPHTHGFACDKTCTECWGFCHPNCPANESIKKE